VNFLLHDELYKVKTRAKSKPSPPNIYCDSPSTINVLLQTLAAKTYMVCSEPVKFKHSKKETQFCHTSVALVSSRGLYTKNLHCIYLLKSSTLYFSN